MATGLPGVKAIHSKAPPERPEPSNPQERDAIDLLSFWAIGCVPAAQVVHWADREIEACGDDIPPYWLIELSVRGPRDYSNLLEDYPKGRHLEFQEALPAKIEEVFLFPSGSPKRFMSWVVDAAMGEGLDDPDVDFAYEIDHIWRDCGEQSRALLKVEEYLRRRRPQCTRLSEILRRPQGPARPDPEQASL